MNFDELGLPQNILRALEVLGFATATEIQAATIPAALTGCDLIGRSATGSGKTFAYGLPLIAGLADNDEVQSLIVCPTRELAEQVAGELKKITNSLDRIKVALLCGGMDMRRQISSLKSAKIAVGTPGRIIDHLNRRTLRTGGIRAVILDEADEMLKMGFEEDMRVILASLPSPRQTMMFSATMPAGAKAIAAKFMTEPKIIEISGQTTTVETVRQGYIFCKNADKAAVTAELLRALDTDKCIIFCNTRSDVERLADSLKEKHFNVRALHGLMRQSERKRAMDAARSYDGAILVATDVAARGIDIKDLEVVINYDLPHEYDFYIHRVGRTARAGKSGTAVTLVSTRVQQERLRGIAKDAGCEISQMSLSEGKLSAGGEELDPLARARKEAERDGNLSAAKETAAREAQDRERTKKEDGIAESMLRALRRHSHNDALLEQLRTFGYTDGELLDAALSLIVEGGQKHGRPHHPDRNGKPFSKPPRKDKRDGDRGPRREKRKNR